MPLKSTLPSRGQSSERPLGPSTSGPSSNTSWRQQFQQAIRDPTELCDYLGLPKSLHEPARKAAASFPLFAPWSYVKRMRPGDPADPLLRQVLPIGDETSSPSGFTQDPVGDAEAKQQPGLIQKYRGRVLLITTGTCAIHCRYCFRRHYPYDAEPKSLEAWRPALEQIATDQSIQEVILSGGDPLSLSDSRLQSLVNELDRIHHLRRIRIHSRLPIVIPDRVTDQMLDWLTSSHLQPYFVLHANHANELDSQVLGQVGRIRQRGVTMLNQAVLLQGVNDSIEAQVELCERLSDHGVLPYYLHQLDRVQGAAHFEVPEELGRQIIQQLRSRLPGYAVPRYVREVAGEANKTVLL